MRYRMRIPFSFIAVVLFAAALAACGGGDDGDAEGGDATPAATMTQVSAPTTVVGTPAATAATAAPAEAPAAPAPFGIATLDGLKCEGAWTNETFGSTGPFAATFHTANGGGSVELEIGGNAFGGQGGTVEAPFTQNGGTTVFDVDLAFLGRAMFSFDGSAPGQAVLEAPPALGPGSEVMLTDFGFDGTTLTAGVEITFPGGSTAHSVLESTCG